MAAKKNPLPTMQTYFVRSANYHDGAEVDAASAADAVKDVLESGLIEEADGPEFLVYILDRKVTRKVVFVEEE